MGTEYPQISNFSISFYDAKCLYTDYAIYGYTIPKVSAFVTAHPDYPIKRWRLKGGGIDKSGDFHFMNGYEDINFMVGGDVFRTWSNTNLTLTIEDTRGETASFTSDVYVQSYNRPLIHSLSAYRTDENGIAKVDGEYIKVNASATPSPIKDSAGEEVNTLSCYLSWKKATESSYSHFEPMLNTEPYIFAADKDFNYDIRLTVRDKYLQTVAYCNVIGDSKDFNIADGGGGAAIGTKAEKGYFDVAYKSRFQKGISAKEKISSDEGVVSTGTGSKGDFLSFGEATRIYTIYHQSPVYDEKSEEYSYQIVVDSWGDFNDCTNIGLYGVYYDVDVSSENYYKVLNAPCEKAGTLRVYNATGDTEDSATEQYFMQEYVVYDGSAVYRRCLSKIRDNEDVEWPEEWNFGEWQCYTSEVCGRSDNWTYKKHSDGTAECWGIFKYSKHQSYDSNSVEGKYMHYHDVSLPFEFVEGPCATFSASSGSGLAYPVRIDTTIDNLRWYLHTNQDNVEIKIHIIVNGRWK